MGATREIGAWVAGASLQAMPDEVVERARAGVIDTIGVILAGIGEPGARVAAGRGGGGGEGSGGAGAGGGGGGGCGGSPRGWSPRTAARRSRPSWAPACGRRS